MSARSEQLKEALIRAKAEALNYADVDDGGTCNFDAPTISLPYWRKQEIDEAVSGAGLRYFVHHTFGVKSYVICGGTHGQANRRTVMAEAMYRSLKAAGYDVSMYYQMD